MSFISGLPVPREYQIPNSHHAIPLDENDSIPVNFLPLFVYIISYTLLYTVNVLCRYPATWMLFCRWLITTRQRGVPDPKRKSPTAPPTRASRGDLPFLSHTLPHCIAYILVSFWFWWNILEYTFHSHYCILHSFFTVLLNPTYDCDYNYNYNHTCKDTTPSLSAISAPQSSHHLPPPYRRQ